MRISRRALLGGATAFLVAGKEKAIMRTDFGPVLDTHQHLWDLERIIPPWLSGSPEILRKRYTNREYEEATESLDVTNAIYMEVDLSPEDHLKEAEEVLRVIRDGRSPTVAAVIGGRPASTGFKAYLDRFRDSPEVKGVRQVLHGRSNPRGECLDPSFVRGMRLLGERGLRFDLCLRPAELDDAAVLAERCPETQFILDHCGNADPKAFRAGEANPSHDPESWKRSIDRLAGRPNVVCKISGIIARVPKAWVASDLAPIVNHCLDRFGPDRVVFGGDWPVCLLGASMPAWVNALRKIVAARPESEQRKLFHDNALHLYGISRQGN